MERRNEVARKLAEQFENSLLDGTLDIGPSFKHGEHSSQPNSDGEAETGGKRKLLAHAGSKSSEPSSAPKTHPVFSKPERVSIDIEKTQSLVRVLNKEKGIEGTILCSGYNAEEGPFIVIPGSGDGNIRLLEGSDLLDALLTYLWRIHGIDYYGLVELENPKGFRHIRASANKSEDGSSGAIELVTKLDAFWKERILGSDPTEKIRGKEKFVLDESENEQDGTSGKITPVDVITISSSSSDEGDDGDEGESSGWGAIKRRTFAEAVKYYGGFDKVTPKKMGNYFKLKKVEIDSKVLSRKLMEEKKRFKEQ